MKKRRKLIKRRMVLLNCSLIIATVFLIGFIAIFSYTKINQQNATSLSKQLVSQASKNIEYLTHDLKGIADVAHCDKNIQTVLTTPVYSISKKYELTENIKRLLSDISKTRSDISSILIVSNDSVICNTSLNLNYKFSVQPWYKNLLAKGDSVLLKPHKQSYVQNSSEMVLSYAQRINHFDNRPTSSVIIIDFKLSAIERLLSGSVSGESGYIMVVDDDANVIYHPDYSYVYRSWNEMYLKDVIKTDDLIISEVLISDKDDFLMTLNDRNLLITRHRVQGSDWTVVGVYPQNEIMKSQNYVILLMVGIGLLITVVGLFSTTLVSGLIFNPLSELQLRMKTPQVSPPTNTQYLPDEMGELNQSYDAMLNRIHLLMEENVGKEKQKRKAELKALQSQINPHFLYNTLDSIVWMAESNSKVAAKMTESLAKLFRLSLSKGREIIPIADEVEHVKTYLNIQQLRYEDQFNFKIDVDPELMENMTLKLILQPIAENAIYHGIKNKRVKGNLLIKGRRYLDTVVFQVMDDGPGIPEEKLKTILSSEREGKGFSGIGVKNVNERLKLYFGNQYGLEFYSVYGVGTVVDIIFPLMEGEESAHDSN